VFLVLLVLFVAVPVAELYVIVQAADAFGVFETVAALILIGFAGAWLCKREGLTTLARLREALNLGRIPTRELQDGALILVAGALLLTPGFIGDVVGILLLLPPTRAVVRPLLARLLRGRLRIATTVSAGPTGRWVGDVVDTDSRPRQRGEDDGPPGPIPLGP
jgi:UPF0716 protein FxsA